MGQSCRDSQSSTITIMKMFVVLALVDSSVHSPLLRAFSNVPALTYNSAVNTLPLTYNTAVNTLPATYSHAVATPFVRAVAPAVSTNAVAPAVTYKAVATPAVTYNTAAVSPVVYAQHQVASHTVTHYNSPTHYTAVSNGAFGPKYIARNGPVQHIVKREADAKAGADADALVYTFPWNTAVKTLPATYNHAVATPVVNSDATPVVTYNAAVNNVVATPSVYNTALHHGVVAASVYNAAVHHGVAAPSVYNAAVHRGVVSPSVYSTAFNHVVAAPSVYNAAPHAVALTPQGVTHSSNVGVCTNNLGAVVPC